MHSDSNEHPVSQRAPREPMFNLPAVVLILAGICVGIHLIREFLLGPSGDLLVILHFSFIPLRFTGGAPLDAYALISPVSYSLLHGNAVHLIVNMIWLAAFGSPLANRLGAGHFIVLWVVTSVAAVALHFVLHPYDAAPLVGASGAISGMMGAAARFAFRTARLNGRPYFIGPVLPVTEVFRSRMTLTFLVVWFVVNLAVGLGLAAAPDAPRIAWEAHIGGLIAGFFLVSLLDPHRERSLR